jgi:hypothetical protein
MGKVFRARDDVSTAPRQLFKSRLLNFGLAVALTAAGMATTLTAQQQQPPPGGRLAITHPVTTAYICETSVGVWSC